MANSQGHCFFPEKNFKHEGWDARLSSRLYSFGSQIMNYWYASLFRAIIGDHGIRQVTEDQKKTKAAPIPEYRSRSSGDNVRYADFFNREILPTLSRGAPRLSDYRQPVGLAA
ncbi:MAG: hypothetical protein ABIA21_04005 [Candidatus Aenigmatarchaeota archaeon]